VKDPDSKYHNHLLNRIPNWKVCHFLVWLANRMMCRAGSRWTLTKKYRKPRRGKQYGWGGSLRRKDAKVFAIYLITRRSYDNAKENYRREAESLARADAVRDQHRFANPPQQSKPVVQQTVIAVRNAKELLALMEQMSKKGIN